MESLDLSGLQPVEDAPKALDTSKLQSLDVSGLQPVDAPSGITPDSALYTGGQAALRATPSALGGIAGFTAGFPIGAEIGAFGGPYAPVTSLIGGLITGSIGAFGGGYGAGKVANAVVPPSPQELANKEAHPTAAAIGEFAPNLALFRPSPTLLAQAARLEGPALATVAKGAAINTGMGAGNRALEQTVNGGDKPFDYGHVFSPAEIGKDAALGGLFFHKPTAIGSVVEKPGEYVGNKVLQPFNRGKYSKAAETANTNQTFEDLNAAQQAAQEQPQPAPTEQKPVEPTATKQETTQESNPGQNDHWYNHYNESEKNNLEAAVKYEKEAADAEKNGDRQDLIDFYKTTAENSRRRAEVYRKYKEKVASLSGIGEEYQYKPIPDSEFEAPVAPASSTPPAPQVVPEPVVTTPPVQEAKPVELVAPNNKAKDIALPDGMPEPDLSDKYSKQVYYSALESDVIDGMRTESGPLKVSDLDTVEFATQVLRRSLEKAKAFINANETGQLGYYSEITNIKKIKARLLELRANESNVAPEQSVQEPFAPVVKPEPQPAPVVETSTPTPEPSLQKELPDVDMSKPNLKREYDRSMGSDEIAGIALGGKQIKLSDIKDLNTANKVLDAVKRMANASVNANQQHTLTYASNMADIIKIKAKILELTPSKEVKQPEAASPAVEAVKPVAEVKPEVKQPEPIKEPEGIINARKQLAALEASGNGEGNQANARKEYIRKWELKNGLEPTVPEVVKPQAEVKPAPAPEPAPEVKPVEVAPEPAPEATATAVQPNVKPASTPEREAKIKSILDSAYDSDVSHTNSVGEVYELKGSNGKWYRPEGFPLGVKNTGEKRLAGYVIRDKHGVGIGRLFKTEAEANDFQEANRQAKKDEFRKSLEESDGSKLDEKAKFWANEKARFDRLNPEVAAKRNKPIAQELPKVEPTPAVEPERAIKPNAAQEGGAVRNTDNLTVQKVATSEIKADPKLMQYKATDEVTTGVNEKDKLSGTWDDTKGGVLVVWQPNDPAQHGMANGQKYIVANGHHRLDFAQRSGRDRLNVQILKESEGWSALDARMQAAEINIADGKGSPQDAVKYLQAIREREGESAMLSAAKRVGSNEQARRNVDIAKGLKGETLDLFINEKIDPKQAQAIALHSPDDPAIQSSGAKAAMKGMNPESIVDVMNTVRELRNERLGMKNDAVQQGTMFEQMGMDEGKLQDIAERLAMKVAEKRAGIDDKLRAVQGAAKRPEKAGAGGVKVENVEKTKAYIEELKGQRDALENWRNDPELKQKIYDEAGITKADEAAAYGTKPSEPTEASQTEIPGTSVADNFNLSGEKVVEPKAYADMTPEEQAKYRKENDSATLDMFGSEPSQEQPGKSKLEKWADDRLGPDKVNSILDPELWAAATVKGSYILARGAKDFASWSKQMVKEFGRGIQPHLQKLWGDVNNPDKVKAAIAKADVKADETNSPKTNEKAAEASDSFDNAQKAEREIAKGEKPEVSVGGKVYRSITDAAPVKFFKSIGTRMRKVASNNPQSEAVAKIVNDFALTPGTKGEDAKPDYNTSVSRQREIFVNRLSMALAPVLNDVRSMTPEQRSTFNDLFVKAMEGRLPNEVKGKTGEAIKATKAILEEMHQYGLDAGLDIGKVAEYFPRATNADAVVADPNGFVEAAAKAYEMKWNREQAAKETNQTLDVGGTANKPDFKEQARAWRDAILLGEEGIDFEKGIFDRNKGASSADFQKERVFTPEEAALFDKYREKDVATLLSRYANNIVRRAELARRLGAKGEGWAEAKRKMFDEGVSADDIKELETALKSNLGVTSTQLNANQTAWMDANNLVVTAAYLRNTGLLNLVEPGAIGVRTGNALDTPRILAQNLLRVRNVLTRLSPAETQAARTQIEAIYGKGHDIYSALGIEMGLTSVHDGISSPSFGFHGDEGASASGKLREAVDNIHRLYGIHATEVAKRETSLREGSRFIDKTLSWANGENGLQKAFGLTGDTTLATDRLAELGINKSEIPEFGKWVKDMRALSPDEQLTRILDRNDPMAAKYRNALGVFSKQSVVQATSASKQIQSKDSPLGRLFFQLSTYVNEWSMQQGRYMGETAKKVVGKNGYSAAERLMATGTYGAFALLSAGYYGLSELRKLINGHKEKELKPGQAPAWVRDSADAVMWTGIAGPFEMIWKAVERGQMPMGVLGNTAGQSIKAAKEFADNPDSNAKQRTAAKLAYRVGVVPAVNTGLAALGGPIPAAAAQVVAGTRTENAMADEVAGPVVAKGKSLIPTPPKPPAPPKPKPQK